MPYVKLTLLSGYGVRAEEARLMAQGVVACLRKPVMLRDLVAAIQEVLQL
ncbi:MAG TPA: hypothetical protein VLL52_03925 [Anaerolineae bacterium]|nr:hypothetical protein [Anaerolineae bacterium]